jgi:nitrite reductase (NADH) small subunit
MRATTTATETVATTATTTATATAMTTATGPVTGTACGTPTAAANAVDTAPRVGTEHVQVHDGQGWFTVCPLDGLTPGRGVAALLRDGSQAAVFLDRAGRTYVIGNQDPFTGACVLSRGLLGSDRGALFVASPLLKQRFDLRTGHCLDEEGVSVPVFRSRTR